MNVVLDETVEEQGSSKTNIGMVVRINYAIIKNKNIFYFNSFEDLKHSLNILISFKRSKESLILDSNFPSI